jgi:hypothetical protein
MRETRPTYSGELEPVKVDVQALSRKLQSSLRSMLDGELSDLVVDVDSRPIAGPTPEWRVNVPVKIPRLYSIISELVDQADMFCRAFVELGAMEPRQFTVSVWCLGVNESTIKGSFD